MKDFRNTLMDSRVPDKIQALIKKIIPPKGIKRKNIEGAELLDFSVEEVVIQREELDVSEEENETDVDEAELSEANPSEVEAVADIPPENTGLGNRNRATSLVDICKDEDINKDARFLDAIQKVFDENETSLLFKPNAIKMKLASVDARKGVKKRIKHSNSTTSDASDTRVGDDIISDEERNIFDTFDNLL